jgi:hypothetical protein
LKSRTVMPYQTESPVLELSREGLKPHTAKREMIEKLCLVAIGCAIFFLFLEGVCSSVFASYQLFSSQNHGTLSGAVMHFDDQLGWVTVPNFHQENYFAPGIGLRTNSLGFRANEEFTTEVPSNRLRLICSGDSFTFGEGVGNDHTWCQLLESLNPRFQTVNLGESGYGVDQMYLWYKRQAPMLAHDVHLFAFIVEDFRRMQLANYVGYGKPVLRLRNGELTSENVPVPRQSSVLPWLQRERVRLQEFRSVKLLSSLAGWVLPVRDAFSDGPTEEQAQIIDKMFENLQQVGRQSNSTLVLVCLPTTVHQHEQSGPAPAWRAWIRAESARRRIRFIDLVEDFHKLPVTEQDGMFIWPDSVHYFAEAPGHYDDEGNAWVAQDLYTQLIELPEVAKKLAPQAEVRNGRRQASNQP